MTKAQISKYVQSFPVTANELIDFDKQEFYNWQGNKLGNDLFINDPDRAERIHDAAEYGADGSTHSENIDDIREYAAELKHEFASKLFRNSDELSDKQYLAVDNALEKRYDRLEQDLLRIELWHEKNGTLYQQVG